MVSFRISIFANLLGDGRAFNATDGDIDQRPLLIAIDLDAEGVYREEFKSVLGSDSIRTLHLSVVSCSGVGIEEELSKGHIVIFPVPVKDLLYIESDFDKA